MDFDDVVQIPVDNYQDATLIESVDDDDKFEWAADPFDHKTQLASEDSAMIDLIRIEVCNTSCGLGSSRSTANAD